MRLAGSPSWQLSVSVDTSLHLALFVRDALGLDTAADPLSPPPLTYRPPDRRAVLGEEGRARAAHAWPTWWRAVLAFEAGSQVTASGADFTAWHTARAEARIGDVGVPPDFEALAATPDLQHAVRALFDEGHRWREHTLALPVRGSAARRPGPPGPQFPLELPGMIADDVIARFGVSPEQVRGVVLVLGVDGLWWRTLGPGVVLAAAGCLSDTKDGPDILREVFEAPLRSV